MILNLMKTTLFGPFNGMYWSKGGPAAGQPSTLQVWILKQIFLAYPDLKLNQHWTEAGATPFQIFSNRTRMIWLQSFQHASASNQSYFYWFTHTESLIMIFVMFVLNNRLWFLFLLLNICRWTDVFLDCRYQQYMLYSKTKYHFKLTRSRNKFFLI